MATTRADIQMLFEDIYHRVTQISTQNPGRLDQFMDDIRAVVGKWGDSPVTNKVQSIDGLSPSQAIAYQKLTDFINSTETWFRLKGYAGTGKSYTIARFIQYLIERKIKFCVAAPTHKAVKTLVKMLEGYGLIKGKDFNAFTLAKLLGKAADIDYQQGKEVFLTKGENQITDYDVVIIDEFSMISKESFADIYNQIEGEDTKIIFVGDAAQLPPANEAISVVANHPEIYSEASLTKIMRYDGDIARVAEEIRSDSTYRNFLYRFKTTSDRTITVLPEQAWLENAVNHFMTDSWLENPDYCRAITWRNTTVTKFNTIIRQKIYGDGVPDFISGDRLVSRSPLFRWSVLMGDWELVADNREEFTVIDDEIEITKHPIYGWDVYLVRVQSEQGHELTLKILPQKSFDLRKKEKQKVSKEAKALKELGDQEYKQKWRLFFDMEKEFDNVTHALCLTAHSAQGSSIDHVFLYAKEMRFCDEKQQILYTSLTRAKSCCYVCQ